MAESVFIRGEQGTIFKMDLPLHEAIEDRLRKGYLHRVNADGSLYTERDEAVAALPTERPAVNAPKIDWIGWAVTSGASPDDAEAMTKADLIEKYGDK
jgi:hypothetical protein